MDRLVAWFWTMKLIMMAPTCKETTTTRVTNLNGQIVFASLEKISILKKVMVWIAISNRGISKPLFRASKSEAVDSGIYINEYIASYHPWASPRLK